MKIKLVGERRGEHVHSRLFMGEGDTLALCGTLVMRTGEWQIFGASLSTAARAFGPDHLRVELLDPLAAGAVVLAGSDARLEAADGEPQA